MMIPLQRSDSEVFEAKLFKFCRSPAHRELGQIQHYRHANLTHGGLALGETTAVGVVNIAWSCCSWHRVTNSALTAQVQNIT